MNPAREKTAEQTIVLVGAGPAHLTVLARMAAFQAAPIRWVLIDANLFYFVPHMTAEVMSGFYGLDDFHIDLRILAEKKQITFIHDEVVSLLPQQKKLMTAAGRMLDYDLVSFETGAVPVEQEDDVPAEGSFAVRPVKNVLQIRNEIETLLELFPKKQIDIAVLGGGIAGVEYAINMSEILQQRQPESGWQVYLIEAQPEILPGLPKPAIAVARKMLRVNDVEIRTQAVVQHVQSNRLVLEFGETIDYDLAVVATGQKVSDIFNQASLGTDEQGALKVNPTLQSVLHPEVFACGDCAQVVKVPAERSVAQALQQGALLAHNLPAMVCRTPLKTMTPQRRFLRFISLGNTNALCIAGRYVFSGSWVLFWKRRREQRLLKRLSC
ncbi:FAD-dependent oxidoreductase [bacterium]|nr:FAD-dependent oxidoreductase [bacterium]